MTDRERGATTAAVLLALLALLAWWLWRKLGVLFAGVRRAVDAHAAQLDGATTTATDTLGGIATRTDAATSSAPAGSSPSGGGSASPGSPPAGGSGGATLTPAGLLEGVPAFTSSAPASAAQDAAAAVPGGRIITDAADPYTPPQDVETTRAAGIQEEIATLAASGATSYFLPRTSSGGSLPSLSPMSSPWVGGWTSIR